MADRNGYIGRAPGDSAVTVARQIFTATGVTTDFTFASGYTPGYFEIYINGVKQIEGGDYTSTDGSTFSILNGGASNGDVIEGVAYKAFNAATATIGISSEGTPISTQANTLNFVGTGNTFALRGTTIDVSISGGGAGAGGTWSNYDSNAGVTTTKKVKIQNNLEVTGITTSTGGFVGALTGNASGTAGGLTGTPDIAIRNITGVAATFTGVLTYEDVTNVDSVGIITARSDVSIADKIIHTTDTNTAIRFPAADTFTVETNGSERLRVRSTGDVGIGTVLPGNALHVFKTGDGQTPVLFETSNATGKLRFYNDSNGWSLDSEGDLRFVSGRTGSGAPTRLTISAAGAATFTGTVSDSIGPLRRLGVNGQSGAYAFVVGDAGKIIRSSGSGAALTLNQNIFTAGDMISVFNVSGGNNTVVQGTGVTLYNTADAATGTRTIAAKGMCTIVCTASNEFAISGSQLT